MVKKLLIALAIVVVLLVAAVLIVPGLIPTETYANRIAAEVEAATGRKLTIGGDVDVSVIPRVAIAMEDVAFANAPGGQAENMATLARLDVQLALWPLLTGEVVIDRFVLVEPVIALEVNEQGQPNWQFSRAGAPAGGAQPAPQPGEAQPETAPPSGDAAGGPRGGPADIRLGEVRIEDGRVSYADAQSGTRQEVTDLDLTLALPNLDSPLAAEGALTWNDERLNLGLGAETPRILLEGGVTPATLSLASEPVTLEWQGTLVMPAAAGAPPKASGPLELTVPSVREAAAWAGSPIQGMEGGLGPLSIQGDLTLDGARVAFTEAAIALDEIDAQGALTVDANGQKPKLTGRLDVETLDLNPYLPPEGGGAADGQDGGGQDGGGQAGGTPAQQQQPAQGWSTEPIDLSPLRAADAEFELTAGAILFREIEIGKSALKLTLAGGRLTADLTEMALYQGKGTATLVADGSGQVPAVEARLNLEGVQAEPLLTDAAGFERLSGTAGAQMEVSAQGDSQAAMVAASNGRGNLAFRDGAIKGLNLAAMLRNVESAFLDPSAREAQATDFSELTGSFTIENGLLRNDDLQLLSPLLRVNGSGTANLPERTLDYRLEPKAVASAEGQGGERGLAGVMVPVEITGPWNDLSYRPDLEGIIRQQIKDPEKALEQLRGLGGSSSEGGTSEGGDGGSEKPALPDPGETLKNIFGR